jgi:hypothetical protein
MLLDALLYPIFICLLYILGKGVLRQDYPAWFQLAAALLAIGFIAVLVNFFSGVNAPISYLALGALFLLGCARLRRADASGLAQCMLLAALLSPLASAMDMGADAGLYHLPHQLWLRDEKIVFGLANFHSRYGFSSLLEYIGAPIWIGEQFKLLSYVMATFDLILVLFLLELARAKNPYTLAVGFLITLGLLLRCHYFKISYTSTDVPMGLMFVIAFLYGMRLLLEEARLDRKSLTIFFTCAIMSFMFKLSGVLIFLWVAFVLLAGWRQGRLNMRDLFIGAWLPALLVIIWTVKSVIVSGCLLYPLAATCLDVPWSAVEKAVENSFGITYWAQWPGRGAATDWWFTAWWLPKNATFLLSIAMAVFISAGAYGYFFRKPLAKRRDIVIPAAIFLAITLVAWFLKAPTPRFGIGSFVLLPMLVAVGIFGFNALDEQKARLPAPTLASALVLLLTVKFGFLEPNANLRLGFDMLTVPDAVETKVDEHFGIRSGPDCMCFTKKYCGPDVRPVIREYKGYKYFAGGPIE